MNSLFGCAIVFIAGIAAVAGDAVNVTDCGSVDGKIVSVDIDPCPSLPCTMKRGTQVTVSVSFAPNLKSSSVTSKLYGIIAGTAIPYPITCKDACQCGVTCPTAQGSTYSYKTTMDVPSAAPSLKLIVKHELQDDSGKDIVCWEIPAQIV